MIAKAGVGRAHLSWTARNMLSQLGKLRCLRGKTPRGTPSQLADASWMATPRRADRQRSGCASGFPRKQPHAKVGDEEGAKSATADCLARSRATRRRWSVCHQLSVLVQADDRLAVSEVLPKRTKEKRERNGGSPFHGLTRSEGVDCCWSAARAGGRGRLQVYSTRIAGCRGGALA